MTLELPPIGFPPLGVSGVPFPTLPLCTLPTLLPAFQGSHLAQPGSWPIGLLSTPSAPHEPEDCMVALWEGPWPALRCVSPPHQERTPGTSQPCYTTVFFLRDVLSPIPRASSFLCPSRSRCSPRHVTHLWLLDGAPCLDPEPREGRAQPLCL